MAYQNGYGPGYAPGYADARRNAYPTYPGHGHAGYPATQSWPNDPSWPDQTWPDPAGGGHPDRPGYGPPPPPPVPPRTPVGVHIVAVLQYLTGLVLVLAAGVIGVVTFNEGRIGDTELPEGLRGAVTGAGIAIAALALVAGLIAFSIGRRLHRGRRGARLLVLVLSAVSLAVNIYTLVTTGVADPLSGLVLPTLYLVLLNTRDARAWFRYPR